MKKSGNNFPLDEKVLNLFSNSLLRTTLPLTETEIARHVTRFFSVLAEQKQTCPVFLVPCPLTILLLTASSIPASSELYSNVCSVLKNLSNSLLPLERVTFFLFFLNHKLQIAKLLNCLSNILLLWIFFVCSQSTLSNPCTSHPCIIYFLWCTSHSK